MPDIAATRPSGGAPVESTWGQQMHDAIEGIQSGSASVVFSSNVESAELTVTFPRAFTGGPVNVQITSHSHHYQISLSQGAGVTTTTFKVRGRYIPGTAANTTIGFFWVAIGPMG